MHVDALWVLNSERDTWGASLRQTHEGDQPQQVDLLLVEDVLGTPPFAPFHNPGPGPLRPLVAHLGISTPEHSAEEKELEKPTKRKTTLLFLWGGRSFEERHTHIEHIQSTFGS